MSPSTRLKGMISGSRGGLELRRGGGGIKEVQAGFNAALAW